MGVGNGFEDHEFVVAASADEGAGALASLANVLQLVIRILPIPTRCSCASCHPRVELSKEFRVLCKVQRWIAFAKSLMGLVGDDMISRQSDTVFES